MSVEMDGMEFRLDIYFPSRALSRTFLLGRPSVFRLGVQDNDWQLENEAVSSSAERGSHAFDVNCMQASCEASCSSPLAWALRYLREARGVPAKLEMRMYIFERVWNHTKGEDFSNLLEYTGC